MSSRIFRFFIVSLLTLSVSCQDKENRNPSDTEIFSAEEKKDKLREDDRPMQQSYLLATMRENGELSSFLEDFQKSGLEEEFVGEEGTYTIFAPSNAAYDRIPAKEMNESAERSKGGDLRYYMVEGEMIIDYLREKIRASGDGRYEFRTALGEKLWATEEGDKIVLIDVLGNKATILTSKMDEYYGVYHMIDNTLQSGKKQ